MKTVIYDSKLINLTHYETISDKNFNKKLAKDEQEYKKVSYSLKKSYDVDYYNVYKISERII